MSCTTNDSQLSGSQGLQQWQQLLMMHNWDSKLSAMSHSWSDINKKKATSTKTTNLRQWPPVVFASCHKHLAVSTILTIVSHEVIQKLKIKLSVLIFVFMTCFADAVKSLCREGTFVLALEILENLYPKGHRSWRTLPIQSCVCPICLTAPSSATVSTFETMKSFQV